MKLSKRLKSLAALVSSDDIVADIGCDHAYLDIYLVQNNIVPFTLACDINEKALNNGIKNIKKYGLEDKITTRLGDGINFLNEDINTLIVSGMGTSTIIKILSNKNIDQINKLIIESNNNHFLLRTYLTNHGFYISHESTIYDNGKYYINIVFLRGNKKYSSKELKYGPLLIKGNKDYYEYLYNKNKQIYENIPRYKIIEKIKLLKDIKYFKRLKK